MGSVIKEGGVEEVRVEIENAEEMKERLEKSTSVGNSKEEIPPLDIKDYEELGLIIDLGELGDTSYENAGIDFNSMFSDFFPEDEEKLMETTPYVDPVGVLSSTIPSLMELEKWMEIPPPEEFKFGGEGSSFTTQASWDFELMEWIWEPYTYDEYFRFYHQG
ncbi:hypothetical protein MTR67_010224 [Solanum verrucosum]|uniref:Uncharacterized protein n=1 Tax=Solanum verrucosum TaxID=315347 RepID=A0AAF0TFJ6_SOLVR|nr:hypothetical protein MTR67_010224 [Solanum verrucosum]